MVVLRAGLANLDFTIAVMQKTQSAAFGSVCPMTNWQQLGVEADVLLSD